ncbi:YpiF family protein [Alkalicoccus daliensis]|uniref:DUF2487 family protein n=1 Tax=Alkalicoccus daliensis TaxID=745820 RepID=A0A1H0ATU1_9BACI|nr:YpiF family protein [Alkalicoccus daliensis]SDN36930.1 Protein of unknown function [Alkalicoccus daliensis]
MRWNENDAKTYQSAKEYVDTAIIPLLPVAGGKEQEEAVRMGEFTSYLTDFLERQYTGRVYLLPPFTYLKEESTEDRLERLKTWTEHFKNQGFSHFLYVTSDSRWRQADARDLGELVWIPAFSLAEMDTNKRQQSIEQQAQQIIPLMTEKWS